MTRTEIKYRPVVAQAILDLDSGKPEIEYPYAEHPWFTAFEVFDFIHGRYGERGWVYMERFDRPTNERFRYRKSPSPGQELVSKIINQFRREGLVEYNPDSLGQTSQWCVGRFDRHAHNRDLLELIAKSS